MNRKHSIELIESIIDTKNVIQIEITEIGTKMSRPTFDSPG